MALSLSAGINVIRCKTQERVQVSAAAAAQIVRHGRRLDPILPERAGDQVSRPCWVHLALRTVLAGSTY